MSPTVFRHGPYRFYFFSREEPRKHVHVLAPDGEAKYWIEPEIELAVSKGLSEKSLEHIRSIVAERREEIVHAWNSHFSG
jgi:hypothetical protein